MTHHKHLALALIPIIGACVLLWGQPYSGTGTTVLVTNEWNLRAFKITNSFPLITQISDRQLGIGGNWFTNIVISNSYSGTIQIGTNFATTKELSAWMAILDSITRTPEDGTTNAWPTNQTYTVNVADGLWTHTNVIDIHTCSEFCTRMRYVENGLTNDFHAAFTGYTVITNSP